MLRAAPSLLPRGRADDSGPPNDPGPPNECAGPPDDPGPPDAAHGTRARPFATLPVLEFERGEPARDPAAPERGRVVTDDRLTYQFGPLERRGLLGQLRAGQAATVGAGGAAAIVALDREPTAGKGMFLAALLVGGCLLIAFAPLRPPHP